MIATALATVGDLLRGFHRHRSDLDSRLLLCRGFGEGRDGDDLVVTVASYRRLLTLPAGLARHRVAGARVDGGELQVRFAAERSED